MTERGLDHVILQVAVDGLRATDDARNNPVPFEILREEACICVRVVATHHHQPIKPELRHDTPRGVVPISNDAATAYGVRPHGGRDADALFVCLDLVPARPDHIKPSLVAVRSDTLHSQIPPSQVGRDAPAW